MANVTYSNVSEKVEALEKDLADLNEEMKNLKTNVRTQKEYVQKKLEWARACVNVFNEGGRVLKFILKKNGEPCVDYRGPFARAFRTDPTGFLPLSENCCYVLKSPKKFSVKPNDSYTLELHLRIDVPCTLKASIKALDDQPETFVLEGWDLEKSEIGPLFLKFKNKSGVERKIARNKPVALLEIKLA